MAKKYVMPRSEELEANVLALVNKWIPRLDLSHIAVANIFCQNMHGEEEDNLDATAAVTTSQWEYRTASITWYLPTIAQMHTDKLEEVVVHELCHVLLGPLHDHMKAGSEKLEELATENIARAILAAAR